MDQTNTNYNNMLNNINLQNEIYMNMNNNMINNMNNNMINDMNNNMINNMNNNNMINNMNNNNMINNMNNNMNKNQMNQNNLNNNNNQNNSFNIMNPNNNFNFINQMNNNINNLNFPQNNNNIYQINQDNQMNLNNQLNQMNQAMNNNDLFNQIQKNNQMLDSSHFWINLNQINLINSIIDFCHGNEYMNYNEKGQIMNLTMRLNPDISLIKQDYNIQDPLHYIKEKKKLIYFINSDYIKKSVKIPLSITIRDLYSIASLYTTLFNTKFLLIYKDSILEKNEKSIETISEGDTIIIIEDRIYPDNSYYNSLLRNCKDNIIFIFFNDNYGKLYVFNFPEYITVSQMLKAIYLKLGYDRRNLYIEHFQSLNNNEIIGKLTYMNHKKHQIYKLYELLGGPIHIFGKEIKIKISNLNAYNCIIGLLNSNKDLVKKIEQENLIIIKEIYSIENKLNIDEEKSLCSLGIKDDINLTIEYERK